MLEEQHHQGQLTEGSWCSKFRIWGRGGRMRSASIATAAVFLSMAACATSPPPVPAAQQAAVRDADGTLYPADVKIWCSRPSAAPTQMSAHDCAVGGGKIGGLATSDPPGARTTVTLTLQQQQAVRVGVANGMKDPESARFGDRMVAAKQPNGLITVCGYVNGKNSFGGYVGMSPFVGMLADLPSGPFKLMDIGSSARDREFVIKLCREHGVEGIS